MGQASGNRPDVPAQNTGEAVDEIVVLAEHHRRLKAGDLQFALTEGVQQVFAFALAAQVQAAAGGLVGAERADVQQAPDAGPVAGFDHGLDEIDVIAAKIALASLVQDADQVDHRMLAGAHR